jgi:SAM-dependent methyltransferase
MQIPWWKKWWSYLFEIHVESTSSFYNEELHVSIVDGRYQLTTPTAIYSWADKYDNFKLAFEKLDFNERSIEDVLILGFGMGSIPYMLERTFGQRFRYTGVEIDEEVIYLASKYVVSSLASDIQIIQADASTFIHMDPNRYDLITMDVFIGHEIPTVFLTGEYLNSLKESLSEDGILMFNMLAQTPSDRAAATQFFGDYFLPVFPSGGIENIKGNMILVSEHTAFQL